MKIKRAISIQAVKELKSAYAPILLRIDIASDRRGVSDKTHAHPTKLLVLKFDLPLHVISTTLCPQISLVWTLF